MRVLAQVGALLCALGFATVLPVPVAADPSADAAAAESMADAIRLRSELAVAVASGETTPAEAIDELRAGGGTPSGLMTDPDAGFVFAAIDVGRRLVVAGKPAEAEKFFQEAEISLDQLVSRTDDTQARAKALFLRKRSLIRGHYLNKRTQAMADIEQALALQPDDKALQKTRDQLAAASGQAVPTNPKR